MTTISVEQIEKQPRMFIDKLREGEEIIITRGVLPVARVLGIRLPKKEKSLYGLLAGKMWISDDFDAPLEEYA